MIHRIIFLCCLVFLCCLATNITFGQSVFQHASWVSPGYVEDSVLRPCPIFKKEFTLGKVVASASLSITAHGLYEASLNTFRVGDAYFTPGWTSYNKRLQYQVYDVASLLHKGANNLQVVIGEGWYRGAFGGMMDRDNYGNDASLLCVLHVRFKDGSSVDIASDSSWSCATGPIRHSDIYGGEVYDNRVSPSSWGSVVVGHYSKELLVSTIAEPVRKQENFKPVHVWHSPSGEQLVDFGQNMAGWVRVQVRGHAGDTVRIFHGEVLDKAGNFYNGNLRDAAATDKYILKGTGVETFEPHFTWHGFRYIKLEGTSLDSTNFTAITLYSDLKRTGTFSCSDSMINKLQHNIEWSLKGNFLDIPTDCPQRSERLGWTGDSQVFFPTAAFNFDVHNFYTKWLADLAADQKDNGSVPNIIPNIYHHHVNAGRNGVAGWGDATVIIPWEMYWIYGDTSILRTQYRSMKNWVGYERSVSSNDMFQNNGYGDWLAPGGDSTSLLLINQCFYAQSIQLLINTAKILDYQDDVLEYTDLLQRVKRAFLSNCLKADGTPTKPTQTAYVLILEMNMLPDSLQAKAAANLATLVSANGNHLATGFLGTPHLLHALSNYGYSDLAYALLHQDTYPSWLYPVKMGATTIWEKWNAIQPDSSVQETSFNHYSYGAVGEWLYKVVGGIKASDPGYRKVIIAPHPGGGLTWAKTNYRGITSNWEIKNDRLFMHVEIPAGTTADVYLPSGRHYQVAAGKYDYKETTLPPSSQKLSAINK
jgi:alpha-L-rhamnosidase